ncbi:hypothetical protein ACJZ2D_004381 [Fusarium nematophilum]
MENYDVQHYVLGLDECLIATLEDPFAFSGRMGLPDAPDARSLGDAGSLSDHPEVLSDLVSSSTESSAYRESTGHQSPVWDYRGTSGKEAEADNCEAANKS